VFDIYKHAAPLGLKPFTMFTGRITSAAAICVIPLSFFFATVTAFASELKRDDTVIFFPTLGRPIATGWELEIHGLVFESENHRLLDAVFRRAIGIHERELTAVEKSTFEARAQFFLVDNERHRRITIRLGGQTVPLTASAPNGHFSARLRFTSEELQQLGLACGTNAPIMFQTTSADQRVHTYSGEVYLLQDTGLSVISDIDDTIKISQVLYHKALLRNTFCRPFQPVLGMAAVYQSWAKNAGAQFHYVSASPWQLYQPLAEFVRNNQFPEGTFHLKTFRVKDQTFFDLFRSPERYKLGVIEPMLERFPNRRFVLVGDSGEKDPETYGVLARKHPQQIAKIFIRDVTHKPADASRYEKAFRGLPKDQWKIFQQPAEIEPLLPAPLKP